MTRLHPGDRVTFRRGKKHDTEYSRGSADLLGVQAVVVDTPTERVGSIDGRVTERVTVQPVLADGSPGLPLDTPTDNLRRNGLRGLVDDGVEKVTRIFSRGAGDGHRMPHAGRWTSHYDRDLQRVVHTDTDGERWSRDPRTSDWKRLP